MGLLLASSDLKFLFWLKAELNKRLNWKIVGKREFAWDWKSAEPALRNYFTSANRGTLRWGLMQKSTKKSTSGFVFTMAGGAVSWESKKQGCVSQSSPEATCMDLSSAAKEAIWLSKIFAVAESASDRRPVLIFVDNQGAIKMSKMLEVTGVRLVRE